MNIGLPTLLVLVCNFTLIISMCFWNSCSYRYFSTRTPYDVLRGDFRDSIVKMKGCELVSMWSLFRHSKRYPSKSFRLNMKNGLVLKDHLAESYAKGNSTMCAQDVENLMKWLPNEDLFEETIQQHLTPEGCIEEKGIAVRFQKAYADFFDSIKEGEFVLRPANSLWVIDTGKCFIEGLKGNFTMEEPKIENDIMAPYQVCPKYIKSVKTNQTTFLEANKYRETQEYKDMIKGVEIRLGLNYTLTPKNITAIEDLCSYVSNSIISRPSPWCAILTPDDLKIIEFYGDLRDYYRNAHGLITATDFGGVILRDLLLRFEEAKNGVGKKLHAYFVHASIMDMVYASLGLFKDDKPLTHKFKDPNRKFRSSKSTGYGVNLVAVLHRCSSEMGSTDYKIVFYFNEKPFKDLCNNGICTWTEFEKMLTPFLNNTLESLDCALEY